MPLSRTDASPERPAPLEPPPHGRLGLFPFAVGLISAIAVLLHSYGAVGVLFFQPVGFVVVGVTVIGSAIAIAAVFRAVTGRRRVIVSIVLALLPVVGVWLAITQSGQIPYGTVFGLPAPVAIGAAVGALSMIALPRWWKLAGAICAVLIAALLLAPIIAEATARAAEEERARQAAIEEGYRNLIAPLTTDLDGTTATINSLSSGGAYVTVERDGREIIAQTRPSGSVDTYDPDAYGCWLVVGTPGFFEGTETRDDFPGCNVIDGGWSNADGSKVGTHLDTRWVQVEAGDGATSDDVLAVFRSLVEVPDDELRAAYEDYLRRDAAL